jgi:predicted DNA-binding transcriptional regulator AlpA
MAPKSRPPKADRQASGSILDRDRLIDSPELAEYLGVELGTLDQWASRGGGPIFHKVGIRRKYAPADVRAWLAERRHATTGEALPAA